MRESMARWSNLRRELRKAVASCREIVAPLDVAPSRQAPAREERRELMLPSIEYTTHCCRTICKNLKRLGHAVTRASQEDPRGRYH